MSPPNSSYVSLAKASNPDRDIRVGRTAAYPKQYWYLIASFIALVSLCRILSLAYAYTRRPQGRSKVWRLPSTVVNVFRIIAFRWTVPLGRSHVMNLAEIFLGVMYLTAMLTWTLINTTATTGLKFDPKYWANRAATMAASQFSLLVALGMKNNIISFLTGVSFEKLCILHRTVARSLCVIIWVHASGRIKIGLGDGSSTLHEERWLQCGILALTSLTVLSILSIRPLRSPRYDLFKIVHFLFGSIILLGAYFHMQIDAQLGHYVWPAILLWGLDRVLRWCRMLLFLQFSSSNNASIDVLSPSFVRVIADKPRFFYWSPGQCAYLTIPSVGLVAHPFTISSVDTRSKEDKLIFLVRVHDGFTKRLLNKAEDGQRMRLLLDGPYSSPPVTRGFDSVVLIAGGTGVAFTLPLLLDLLQQSKQGKRLPCSRILFIWAIRDADHINWISAPLVDALSNLPKDLEVSIKIFITGSATRREELSEDWEDKNSGIGTPSSESEKPGCGGILTASTAVNVTQGERPDFPSLLHAEMSNVKDGRMGVNVCGPFGLAEGIRRALRAPQIGNAMTGQPSIVLHVETFGM
ncbi:iron reductase [Desarmillaria tabescens]|uniref:ferric-chelate reductase (NADPH) n=1 Tax=Armillaria tabescens TaxID=1929756 RepID=A0AA39N0W5_ARMTA|nr:iron reductase [Desarmillaria tabescens]KAK0454111.1 iron reductase [Desarmillaria tabescens]